MKDILGYEGRYAVTEDGRIWNYQTNRFQTLRGSGFANKKLRRKRDYRTVVLWTYGKGYKYFYIHRLVAQTYLPNTENLPVVNHRDGDPMNNHFSNLEWCTQRQNIDHAFKNGLTTRGVKNAQAKLTETQVRQIRKTYSTGKISQAKLAKLYGVTQSNIMHIVHRTSWTWLK